MGDVRDLLKNLQPILHDGTYVFCSVPAGFDPMTIEAIGLFREAEGDTAIVEERLAAAHGLTPLYRAAWITLTVNSDLNDVGMTAAVAQVLADAGISCNVVAAIHHDHVFVPVDRAAAAIDALRRLQSK